jgi:hypothetical protein
MDSCIGRISVCFGKYSEHFRKYKQLKYSHISPRLDILELTTHDILSGAKIYLACADHLNFEADTALSRRDDNFGVFRVRQLVPQISEANMECLA